MVRAVSRSRNRGRGDVFEHLDLFVVALWALSSVEIETWDVVAVAFGWAYGRDFGPGGACR